MAQKKDKSYLNKISPQVKAKLRKYLDGWKKKNMGTMLRNSTKTFKAFNGVQYFKDWFGITNLVSYKIIEVKTTDGLKAICDVAVSMELLFDGKNEPETREVSIRLVQEKSPYTPSVLGSWGVNPPSSLRVFNKESMVAKDGN